MWMVKMRMLVILLKQKEIVGSCHRDDVLLRMPGRVQDLLVEVQTVHGDLVLLPLAPGAHLAWFEHCLWFSNFSRCFQCHFLPRIAIKHSEKVVVTSCHDGGVCSVPSTFKLIKDAIVLVQGAQFGPEILMHLNTR